MIAQKLKYYRAIQRLTQRDLAGSCGVAPSVIGQIESRSKDVALSTVLKICNALDVRVEQLLGDLTEAQRDEMYLANRCVREAREAKKSARLKRQKQRRKERAANSF